MSTTWERIMGGVLYVIEGAVTMSRTDESDTKRQKRILRTVTHYLMALSREERAYLAKILLDGSGEALVLKTAEEKHQDRVRGTPYGCHVDLDDDMDPERCVLTDEDYDPRTSECDLAPRYRIKERCPYWLPISPESRTLAKQLEHSVTPGSP